MADGTIVDNPRTLFITHYKSEKELIEQLKSK